MNYNIKVGDKTFTVEIDDINKRPIVATVDGQVFEVTPETSEQGSATGTLAALYEPDQEQKAAAGREAASANLSGNVMTAPLPGIVIEVFVKPGDQVEAGQVILIIEAMKMKNSIRSTRDGILSAVHVSAGQTVSHKQALVEFKE